jgi:thiomorpholine-carboxylate dehydrogenase
VCGADVVVSAATVNEPLVEGRWLQPDTYVNAVAAVGPSRRELDDAAMDAVIVVESREAAMRESGDILGSGASVYAELGELLAGKVALPAGRRVVYKSLGIAAEDVAAAQLVLERYRSA